MWNKLIETLQKKASKDPSASNEVTSQKAPQDVESCDTNRQALRPSLGLGSRTYALEMINNVLGVPSIARDIEQPQPIRRDSGKRKEDAQVREGRRTDQ